MPCYLILLTEATSNTEEHKMILKLETPTMSWVISEECSNRDGSAQRVP